MVFGATANHTFVSPGTYQVELVVSEPGCLSPACSDTEVKSVTVTGDGPPPPPPPGGLNANFTFSPANPQAGQSVAFNGSSATGNIGAYSWQFGDGGTASGATVAHTFATSGSYSVTLTVQEAGCGNSIPCFDSASQRIWGTPRSANVVVNGGLF